LIQSFGQSGDISGILGIFDFRAIIHYPFFSLMEWIPENRDCPICGSNQRKTIGKRGGRSHRAGLGKETTVVRCQDCTALYTYPTLIPAGNPYDESNFEDYFLHHPDNAKVAAGEVIAEHAEKLLGNIGRVLEVGCGGGGMLQGFLNRGWNCTGVEMTEAFARVAEARGLTIIRKPIEEAELTERFDIVILPAIIEHLYKPVEMLKKCVDVVRPGGFVHIEAPNESALALAAGNLYYKLKGRDWTINLSPTFPSFHVVGFNPKSIKRLIKSANLEIVSLELTQYTVTLPDNVPFIERAGMGILQKLGSLTGRADGISLWAQKP
jgi:2-polyprenyl-3-methyl-5-hydroxy-6-metoxy-1,4-benzoquinol methylase